MVEIENIGKFIKKLNNIGNMDLSNAMALCGQRVKDQAKIELMHSGISNSGEGGLVGSIDYLVIDEHTVEIGSPNKYALYVHEGTGIHAVNKNGRTTPWSYPATDEMVAKYGVPNEDGGYINAYQDASGQWYIRTKGQKPKPFLTNALNKEETNIQKIINDAVKEQILNDNH